MNDKIIEQLGWNEKGLIAAIVQDIETKQVLMMAWVNRDSLMQTIDKQEAVFWSRSRGVIWHKGETSGNVQHIQEIRVDCDGDTLLFLVNPAGAACHTGEVSCFFRALDEYDGKR